MCSRQSEPMFWTNGGPVYCPICVTDTYGTVNWSTIGSDKSLLSVQCQTIIWPNVGFLIIWPLALRTNSNEISIKINYFLMNHELENVCKNGGHFVQEWMGLLTHWCREEMAVIFQTFSNSFSSMKTFVFWIRFNWNLFQMAHLTINRHWLRKWLCAKQEKGIIWTNDD